MTRAGDQRRRPGQALRDSDNGVGHSTGKPERAFSITASPPEEGRPRLRPAQRRARRQGNGRHADRAQRRPRPRRHVHARTSPATPGRHPNVIHARSQHRRILVVDDNHEIHNGLQGNPEPATWNSAPRYESKRFCSMRPARRQTMQFDLDSAFQGQEGLARIVTGRCRRTPARLRGLSGMPPGWDGLKNGFTDLGTVANPGSRGPHWHGLPITPGSNGARLTRPNVALLQEAVRQYRSPAARPRAYESGASRKRRSNGST